VPLARGAPAPWSGQLLTDDLALQLGLGLRSCSERWGAALRYEQSACVFKMDGVERKARLELRFARAKHEACEVALRAEAAKAVRPWWEEPSFTVPAAFAAGALVVGAAAVGITIAIVRLP